MIAPGLKANFETWTLRGESSVIIQDLAQALETGRKAKPEPARLAGALAHAAFTAPEQIAETYDAAAAGWFGAQVEGRAIATDHPPPARLSGDFWREFWLLVDASSGLGSGDATSRTAALGRLVDPSLQSRTAAACSLYPGVIAAARAGFPERTRLDDLAACPQGSLGETFYRLIVDNNFDLEVLDRDALGLAGLTPPLDYLNARMLQTHDLWHIVAGYRTTKLHEVAISAFQMAQFGHGYSAMFLAMVATSLALGHLPTFTMVMDTILSAWVHGRRTPPMLLIPWEAVWSDTTEAVRARFDVAPYDSPYPADVFERYEATALAAARTA